jgi:hypothetical protein
MKTVHCYCCLPAERMLVEKVDESEFPLVSCCACIGTGWNGHTTARLPHFLKT